MNCVSRLQLCPFHWCRTDTRWTVDQNCRSSVSLMRNCSARQVPIGTWPWHPRSRHCQCKRYPLLLHDRPVQWSSQVHTQLSSNHRRDQPAGMDHCSFSQRVSDEWCSVPSVLWRCWLGARKGIRPVKKLEWWGTGMVICLERGADLHMAQLMPLPLTVSCFSKIRIGFTFLVPAHPGSPRKRAVKRVCVRVCVMNYAQWKAAIYFDKHIPYSSMNAAYIYVDLTQ